MVLVRPLQWSVASTGTRAVEGTEYKYFEILGALIEVEGLLDTPTYTLPFSPLKESVNDQVLDLKIPFLLLFDLVSPSRAQVNHT